MNKNQPIRVLHIIGKVVSGGVEAVVMNYYRNIDRTKVQFDFIIDGYEKTYLDDEIISMGGRVFKVEPYSHNMLKNMEQCYHIFKDNNYQIVHSHMNTLSIFPLCAAWFAGVKVRIAHNHSTVAKGEGKRAIIKYILRAFAKIFPTNYCACSAFAGRWMFGKSVYDKGKVKLVKNAIDISKFSYKPEIRQQIRQQLNIEEKFVIGHVGRFAYQKNHAFLIDIFNEIHKQVPNAVLMLIGSGELEQKIKEKVDRLELTKSVLFLGVCHNVSDLFQAMDVFVFPSNFEGLGLVAIEAQSAGLKTIVSEEIPKEAQITNLLEYCYLNQSAEVWANKVLQYRNYNRCKQDDELIKAGFDIRLAAADLAKWYKTISI